MGDMADYFKDMRDHKKRLREKFGIECPVCKKERPRACATILLPQQRCRIDKYKDERPELTEEDHENCY